MISKTLKEKHAELESKCLQFSLGLKLCEIQPGFIKLIKCNDIYKPLYREGKNVFELQIKIMLFSQYSARQ